MFTASCGRLHCQEREANGLAGKCDLAFLESTHERRIACDFNHMSFEQENLHWENSITDKDFDTYPNETAHSRVVFRLSMWNRIPGSIAAEPDLRFPLVECLIELT